MTTQIKENTKVPYQLLPPLTDEEYQALKADIAEHGILVPVDVDEAGHMLDGHHRVKAWCELRAEGIKVPDYSRLIRAGLTEAQKRNHVRSLNLLRRHLTKEQLKEQWSAMRNDGMTYQAIADASGVDDETVRKTVSENSETQPTMVIGKDGKKYPAKKKPRQHKTVIATTKGQEKKVIEAIAEAGEALPDKIVTATRAARIAREFQVSTPQTDDSFALHPNCDLRLGDFRQILPTMPPNSIDLIFTDPPYNNFDSTLWVDLAKLASEVLKPSGLLVSYSGQTYLPSIIKALGTYLDYVWLGALVIRDGPRLSVHQRHIWCTVKPILFYVKPPFSPNSWFTDTFIDRQGDKDHHKLEQTIGAPLYFIEKLTSPGATVLDPFLGTGTNAIASLKLNRHFIGCEIDMEMLVRAKNKINEALKEDGQTDINLQ